MNRSADDFNVWPIDRSPRMKEEDDGARSGGRSDHASSSEDDPHHDIVRRLEAQRGELVDAAEALRAPMEKVDQVQQAVVMTMRHLPMIVFGGGLLMGTLWLTGRWRPPPLRTVLSLTVQGLAVLRAVRAATGGLPPPPPGRRR